MVKTEICCDRCGKVIIDRRTKLTPECGALREQGRGPIDLCEGCTEDFGSWLRTPAELPGLVLSSR